MIIKQNKKQTFWYFVGTLCFFVLFLLVTVFDLRELPHKPSAILDNPAVFWAFRGFCAACCAVMGAGSLWFAWQIFSTKPLIEITDTYLLDYSSATALGEILWEDMASVYIKGAFLNIDLKDPEKYAGKRNCIQRFLVSANHRQGYGDICISTTRFPKQQTEFLSAINEKIRIYDFSQMAK